MNIALSPSQMEKLVKNTVNQHLVVHEQEGGESTADAKPKTGTSSKQSGGTGYPEVGKWESGIERGPGNQVAVTKWSDIVGAKLQRGKANQLKEQVENINPKNLKFGDGGLRNPNQVNDVKILQQKLFDGGFLKTNTMKPTGYFGNLTKSALEKYQQTQKTSTQKNYGNPADITTYPPCIQRYTTKKIFGELKKTPTGQYFVEIYQMGLTGYKFYNNFRVQRPDGKMSNYSCSTNNVSILIDGVDVASENWKKAKDKYTTEYEKRELSKIDNFNADPHDILTVLEMGSLLIPVIGPFVSAGFGLANAALYYKEGETKTAGLFALFSLVPVIGEIPAVKQLGKAGMDALFKKIGTQGTKITLTPLEKEALQGLKANEGVIKKELDNQTIKLSLQALKSGKPLLSKQQKVLRTVSNVGVTGLTYYGLGSGYSAAYDKLGGKPEMNKDLLTKATKSKTVKDIKDEDMELVDGEWVPKE